MKIILSSSFAVFSAALLLIGAGPDRGGGVSRGDGSSRGGGALRGSGGHSIFRKNRVSVPRAAPPRRAVQGQSRPDYPRNDAAGARIFKPAAAAPPAHHAAVVGNAGFARGRAGLERSERIPNRHYWHNDNGMNYSHYYDGRNHWYGFYHGPTFYWTRYYGNRWWWSDHVRNRWVFYANGFWWWTGPGGAPYVYIDNAYYPYQDSGVTVEHEEALTPPAAVPAAGSAGTSTSSPDGLRMVQVSGTEAQAFLYDKAADPPKFVNYLGQNVSKVRFSGGAGGAPLQVLVEYKDNTYALFDADGNSQSAAVKKDEAEAAAPPAATAPAPPSGAPGQ